jgi:S-adenosylmethionine:tRNA ribosyltransferase-isomerase
MRVLEQVMAWAHARGENAFFACEGATSIFIRPGYKFLASNALITNFHLPRSTLLLLVSAIAGRERILRAYHEAINERYRFFSYGDASFLEIDQ